MYTESIEASNNIRFTAPIWGCSCPKTDLIAEVAEDIFCLSCITENVMINIKCKIFANQENNQLVANMSGHNFYVYKNANRLAICLQGNTRR